MKSELTIMLGCTSTCVLEVGVSNEANIYAQRRALASQIEAPAAATPGADDKSKRQLQSADEMWTKWTLEVSIFEDDPDYDDLVAFVDKSLTRMMKECSTKSSKWCPTFMWAGPNAQRGGLWFNMIKDVTFYVYVAPPPPPYSFGAASRMSSMLAAFVASTAALLATRL